MANSLRTLQRSRNMAAIKGKDTKPELAVRSYLHAAGFRFRLHAGKLPGKPDIVLKKHKTVIFVHGCYWHRHSNCKFATTPKTNQDFWLKKFEDNLARDKRNCELLERELWNVVVVWECEVRNQLFKRDLAERITKNV